MTYLLFSIGEIKTLSMSDKTHSYEVKRKTNRALACLTRKVMESRHRLLNGNIEP